MASKNYYQLLEVSPNASADELRSSYRKLALKYHPDRNLSNPQTDEYFKDINIAYQILSDPARRAQYDTSLRNTILPELVLQNEPTPSRPIPHRVTTQTKNGQMSNMQIGLLVGATLFALLAIGVGLILIFSPKTKSAAAPRATRVVFAANTPTLTPIPVISTLSPPGDWVEFETKNATLWLPSSFVGGDMLVNRQESINKVNQLGLYFKNLATLMKAQNTNVVLWMVDKTLKQTDFFTFVKVSHFSETEDTNLDDYIQKLLNDDSNGTPIAMQVAINQTKKLTVLGHEAQRLTFSVMYAGHELVYIFYFIKNGADVWEIDYYVTPQDYIDTLPMIEKSIQTFNIIP